MNIHVVQIELIVDKLTQKGRRALVVLPYIYTSGPRIPNNSGDRSRRHSELTADDEVRAGLTMHTYYCCCCCCCCCICLASDVVLCSDYCCSCVSWCVDVDIMPSLCALIAIFCMYLQRIIRKLQANDMVYITPSGANDDWYWLYATIYEGRSTPACVVSNDFMRDHKVAFAESKAFMRWRSSQIMLFQFDKSMMPVELRGEGYKPPSVTLYEPGRIVLYCYILYPVLIILCLCWTLPVCREVYPGDPASRRERLLAHPSCRPQRLAVRRHLPSPCKKAAGVV